MKLRLLLLACIGLMAAAPNAYAQDPYVIYSPVKNLATLFTGIFGAQGLKVDRRRSRRHAPAHWQRFESNSTSSRPPSWDNW